MALFRLKKHKEDDCGDGCNYIIQKKNRHFWEMYDNMLYTKEDALTRLQYINTFYPNAKPIVR